MASHESNPFAWPVLLPRCRVAVPRATSSLDSTMVQEFLQKVPQELYDKIYDHTFTARASPEQTLITSAGITEYKTHLKLLRVSKASRAQYGKSYFATRTFVTRNPWYHWLGSLSLEQRAQFTDIEVRMSLFWRQRSYGRGPLMSRVTGTILENVRRNVTEHIRVTFGKDLAARVRVAEDRL
ncbi:unnamed protein product [Zymoseptoria tritici ST99CH_3D1]|nr:unnamed protein product [Zymoseptoria tritici ST99CH_3D1]